MSHVSHHAIIVTGCIKDLVELAQLTAVSKGLSVTPVVDSGINLYRSFLIVPDGSKEHWDESDDGDRRRAEFKAEMREPPFVEPDDDGPAPMVSWIEIHYDQLDDEGWESRADVVDGDKRNVAPSAPMTTDCCGG